jgi:hypothetical protein
MPLNDSDESITQNSFIGPTPTTPKPSSVLRLYLCNPNGLQLHSTGGQFTEFLSQVADIEPDIIGITEHNLDTTKQHIQLRMKSSIRSVFAKSHLVTSSSTIPSVHDFKPGGTLIAAQGNITRRIVTSGTDSFGRWAFLELVGKCHWNVVIVIAYQVCQQSFITNNTIKSLSATSQQYIIMRQQDRTYTPREAFISDLTTFIKSIHQRNHGVLLLGDFNEPLSIEHKGMTGLTIECNLTGVMFRLQNHDSFPTYLQGQSRIDYVLASEWVADSVLTGCYEPFGFRTKDDHRNIVLDVDVISLLGTPTNQLDTPDNRKLKSNERSSVRKYILGKTKYLEAHNFQARLDHLQQHWDPIAAEKLDQDWVTASRHAESLCVKNQVVPLFINYPLFVQNIIYCVESWLNVAMAYQWKPQLQI